MPYGPRTYRGDPGIFGSIAKLAGGVIGSVFPGARAISGGINALVRPSRRPAASNIAMPGGAMPRFSGSGGGRGGSKAITTGQRRRGRMNPANPKALRRAIRRQAGFVKLAKKALKGTGYTIVTRGSARRTVNVREAGPGGVTVQR